MEEMSNEKTFEYEMKCRKCGRIAKMYYGTERTTTKKDFLLWASEHSTFPQSHQCECDKGMILFHDIIGHNAIH